MRDIHAGERIMADAQPFIDALATLEESGDAGPIAALFAEGADVSNPLVAHPGKGEQGARDFWTAYRAAFGTIHSEFRNIVEADDVSMLEWVSTGTLDGKDVRYDGVSVLEHGEGGITAFRTYFDPTPLARVVKAG
jgi:ketosteroid isomerase-like protein